MKKIPSLFQRNYDGDRLVRDEVVPGSEWVINGEGIATRKWDGTCVLIENGVMWKRHELKKGKPIPGDFKIAGSQIDPVTGKLTGWIRVGNGPEDKWHRESLANDDTEPGDYVDGTYELVGPKIQGNPERIPRHTLIRHGLDFLPGVPVDFDGIKEYLSGADIEGIVWYHRWNGDMVKIKAKDFGIKRLSVAAVLFLLDRYYDEKPDKPKGNLYGHPWPPLYEVNKRLPKPLAGHAWELKVKVLDNTYWLHLTLVNILTEANVDTKAVDLTHYAPHGTTWTMYYSRFGQISRKAFDNHIVDPMVSWATQLIDSSKYGENGVVEYMMGNGNGRS